MIKRLALVALLALLSSGVTQSFKSVSLLTYGADPTGTFDTSGAWIAALNGGASHIDVPPGQYLLNGTATVPLTNVEIECHGAPAQYNSPPTYGTTGATILLTSTSVQPFTVAGGVRIIGCNFIWPNQTCASPTPTAYPPLFTEPSGSQLSTFLVDNVRIVNGYDFLDQGSTASSDSFGDLKFTNLVGYPIRYWFQLANVPEFWSITGFHSDYGIYQNVAGAPNYYCPNWTAANGAFLHVFGNGNGSTIGSTVSVGGLTFNGQGVFAYNKFIWVDSTGALSETKVHAIFDSIPHIVQVDSGGCAADLDIDGEVYSYQAVFPSPGPGGTDNATAYSFGTPPSSNCITSNVRITGHLFSVQGDVVDITGTGNKGFYVNLSGAGPFGATSTAGTYYFAQVNSSTAVVDFVGNHIETPSGHAGSTRLGFNFANCTSCTVNANSFNGIYNPIVLGSSSVPVSGTGNIATNSPTGGLPIVGTGDYAHRLLTGNVWDKYANPSIVGTACGNTPNGSITTGQATDISGVVTVGGGAATSCTMTFANAWTTNSRCYVQGMALGAQPVVTASTSSTMVVTSTASMSGSIFWYRCDAGW